MSIPSRSRHAGWILVLLAAVLPYLNTIGNDFVLDDLAVVRDNPLIRSLGRLPTLFTSNYWAPLDRSNLYRPVTMASYAVNRALLGPGAAGFHAVNAVLHALASLLVYALLVRWDAGTRPALAAAALFAVHPLHTEAVSGIVGRAELLATLGALATLAFHARAATAPRSWLGRVAAASALAFGLFAKESALGVLPALVAFDLARRRSGSRVALTPQLAYLAVTLLYFAARGAVLDHDKLLAPPVLVRLDNALAGQGAAARVATAASLVPRTLGLTLWPATLSADYSHAQIPLHRSPLAPLPLLGLVLLGALAAALAAALRGGQAALAAALALLAGSYFIVSNLALLIGALYAERFFYLPSAGLALAGGLGLARLPLPRRAATIAALGLVTALAARTALRNRDWRDRPTLYEKTALTSPRSLRALALVAATRREAGDRAGARAALEAAVRIDPKDPWPWNELGYFHGVAEAPLAERALRTALELDPTFAEAHYNLGWILTLTGRPEEAILELRRALELKAYQPRAHIAIAEAYLALGRPADARPHVAAALAAWPESGYTHETIGHLSEGEGDPDAAVAAYERALELDPEHADAAFALGRLRERQGSLGPALAAYRRAWGGRNPPLECFTRAAAILARGGALDRAAEALERGRARLGARAEIENNAGTLALLGGDPAAAGAAWRRALEIDPANEFARRRLTALASGAEPGAEPGAQP